MSDTHVLHDGAVCVDDGALSRALQYGDGVFRTMLWAQGAVVDWPLHRQKLADDCSVLGLEMPPADLADEIRRVVADRERATIKIIVARRPGGRGYRPTTAASERWVYGLPPPPRRADAYRRGIVAAISGVTLSEQPLLAGIKHLNRLDQVLASRDWPDGVDELLMRGAAGHVICGTRTNLFCAVGGDLLTPALDRCGVAGIMRHRILQYARTRGWAVRIAPLSDVDLRRADEIFVCNALIGLWPVRRLGDWRRKAPGPLARALMAELAHPEFMIE